MDSIDYYNKHAIEYYDRTIEADMSSIIEKFVEILPDGAVILDLGCGSGRDSRIFIEEGYDVTSLDGSSELCELAEIHIGKEVHNIKFEDIEFHQVFDGIWACASLLHVEEKDIDCILEKVVNSLTDNGILYMSFQHGDFSGIRNQRYYKDYNTKELKELLSRHKQLEIIEIFKTKDVRKDSSSKKWINVLCRKINRNPKNGRQ